MYFGHLSVGIVTMLDNIEFLIERFYLLLAIIRDI